jgi:hypothetical protein
MIAKFTIDDPTIVTACPPRNKAVLRFQFTIPSVTSPSHPSEKTLQFFLYNNLSCAASAQAGRGGVSVPII